MFETEIFSELNLLFSITKIYLLKFRCFFQWQTKSLLCANGQLDPFSPACATFPAELGIPITRQAIELESCSNSLKTREVM